ELAKLEVAVVARASVPMPAGPGVGSVGGAATFASEAKGKGGELANQAKDLRRQAEQLQNSFKEGDQLKANWQLNEAAAYEQNLDLIKSRDEILAAQKLGNRKAGSGNDGPSVTYHLDSKITVPSRNDEQVLEVAKLSLKPKYYYKVVPVLNRSVYRLADLTNTSKLTLF